MSEEVDLEGINIQSPLPMILEIVKKHAPHEYRIGDSLEEVAERSGWMKCIAFIENKILRSQSLPKLPERKNGK